MPFQARINKFGRAYFVYDADPPNYLPVEDGPETLVLPAILDKSNLLYVNNFTKNQNGNTNSSRNY